MIKQLIRLFNRHTHHWFCINKKMMPELEKGQWYTVSFWIKEDEYGRISMDDLAVFKKKLSKEQRNMINEG